MIAACGQGVVDLSQFFDAPGEVCQQVIDETSGDPVLV